MSERKEIVLDLNEVETYTLAVAINSVAKDAEHDGTRAYLQALANKVNDVTTSTTNGTFKRARLVVEYEA